LCRKTTGIIAELENTYESLFSDLEKANQHFNRVEYGGNT